MFYGTGKLNVKKRQWEGVWKNRGTSVAVIVGLDGYDYKYYQRGHQWSPTDDFNVHISMNGPLQLTFEEQKWFTQNINDMVDHGKEELERLKEKND